MRCSAISKSKPALSRPLVPGRFHQRRRRRRPAERIWTRRLRTKSRAAALAKPALRRKNASRPPGAPLLYDLTSLQRDANGRGFSANAPCRLPSSFTSASKSSLIRAPTHAICRRITSDGKINLEPDRESTRAPFSTKIGSNVETDF